MDEGHVRARQRGPRPNDAARPPTRSNFAPERVVPIELDVLASTKECRVGPDSVADALGSGGIRLEGRPDLVRTFPSWLGGTRFAKYATRGITPA